MRTLFAALLAGVTLAPPSASPQSIEPSLLSALRPRNIGPAGMSGRIAAVEVLPSDPNVIWVGAATGGVWKSENGGTTFAPVFDGERVNGVGAIAIDPNARDVVWVGTGEGNPRNSAGVGAGLYKTVDGGRSWRLMGLEGSERIHRIIVHPYDSDVVWVGAMGPAWSDGQERGVYKTTDGGATWRRVLWANERTGVSDLVIDPSNPMKLFAGMWEFRREPWFFTSGGPGSGLHVSHDGGETWQRYGESEGMPPGDLGRIGLAIAPSDPSVVYALVEADQSVLLRSDDGGRTWRTVNADAGVASRPFYYTDLYVDPANENRLYNLASRMQISVDGGRTFSTMPSDVHPDFHAMWIDPADGRHLLVGTDGGVWVSLDRAATWRLLDNLPVGQFYHVSVDDAVPFNVYGGMQDNGSWRGPSDLWEVGGIRSYHWEEIAFGDGFNALIDPRDPSYGYAMSQGGNLVRFDLRNGERKSIRPWAPDTTELRFNWNAAIALDPFDVGTIYYGSQFVHKSPDRGHSWQIISQDLTSNDPDKQRQRESGGLTIDNSGAENHTTLVTIAPSPVQRDAIWTGSDDGRVHLARAGGGEWEDVTGRIRGVPEATWAPHVEASKHDSATAYVVFDDHRRGNWETYLYRTENWGRDWENVGRRRGIDGFLNTVEEDPVTPNLLFAGGELGLFVSLDRGERWFKWTNAFPTVPVRSLVVHPRDRDLVIGTHGRALWILDDIRPLEALAQNPGLQAEAVHLFEAPVAYVRNAAAVDGYHFAGDAPFRGETRMPGALLTWWVGVADAGSAEVAVFDSDGRLVRTLTGPAARGLNRIAWDLREERPEGIEEEGRGDLRAPEVLPGSYLVRVSVAGVASERPLEVLPDPRVDVPMEERREKVEALRQGLDLESRVAAVRRAARQVREGVQRVLELLGDRQDEEATDLRSAAAELRDGLADASATDEVDRYRRGVLSLASSYDRPTEGQRLDLRRTAEAVERLETKLDAFLGSEVAVFRGRVREAGLEVFPRPLAVGR
jgi:photosystem II stability/assembly factor-like uncharacterized protein